jgi:polyisoprenoid-binding protein YceI
VRAWLALSLFLASSPVAAACLALDGAGSEVEFELIQDGAPFTGRFHRFGGEVCFEGTRVTSVDVWLEPASVDTGWTELDEILQSPVLFDTAAYPRASFRCEQTRMDGAGQIAIGPLTLKGISHPRTLSFTVQAEGATRIVQGELSFPRLDYAIGTGDWADTSLLGDEVTIRFRGRLIESSRANGPDE